MKNRSKEDRLIPSVVRTIRAKQYSYATEKSYVRWILRYIRYHGLRHPREMGEQEISEFLSYLANEGGVSASTQNQALNAIVFLYKHVLRIALGDFATFSRARTPALLPVVLSKQEIGSILERLSGTPKIMVALLYGCGLRQKELLTIRIKDLDFEQSLIFIRQSKGKKDRAVPLPQGLEHALRTLMAKAKDYHDEDLARGLGAVYLPNALARKYPKAAYEFSWQYLFASHKLSKDPRSTRVGRHHIHQSYLIRHIKKAANEAGIHKKISTHTFRHSFATHLLDGNHNIRVVQELLGHKDVKTTMIYTHVVKKKAQTVRSPLDEISKYATTNNDTNSRLIENITPFSPVATESVRYQKGAKEEGLHHKSRDGKRENPNFAKGWSNSSLLKRLFNYFSRSSLTI